MSGEASDQDEAAAVFRETIQVLKGAGFDHAVAGGLATRHWNGAPQRIDDIDLVIRQDDAGQILRALASSGYRVSEMEHSWLHKAFRGGVTIDLIFELKNGTTFDEDLARRRATGEMFGAMVDVIAAEDQVAALAAAVDRSTVGDHWYSIVDILASNDLDWDYLIQRAEQVPLRLLSVIYFASAEGVPVQKGVTDRLLRLAARHG